MTLQKLIAAAPAWLSNIVRVEAGPVNMADSSTTFGNPTSGFRSGATYKPMRELRDAKPLERREAIKTSRTLRAKLGIIKALFENTSRYALGRGLMPTSSCADTEWAKMADEIFAMKTGTKEFDVREELTFAQMQKLLLPDIMCDGDAGAAPVRDERGQPRIQLFPSEAIGDVYGSSYFSNRDGWRDGILRNAEGRPIAYRILKEQTIGRTGGQPYFDYPARTADGARGFYHIGRTDRINANRPLPWLHHGDQSAINILDLNALEMAAAKLNSYFAASITTKNGEPPSSMQDMLSHEVKTIQSVDAAGTATTEQKEQKLINLFGAAALVPLAEDEEMNFFKNERPSTTFTGFIDYLISDIATGFGVPPQFIWGVTGLAGPYARLVLQQADWFFADVADMLICDFCQPVWEDIIADAMNRGELRAPRPGTNWRAVQWQGPGSMTIDKGRDGKLFRDMVLAGMGRRSTWHELNGKNGETENRKAIEEIRRLMDLCDEMGVPHAYFFGKDYKDIGNTSQSNDQGEEDDEEDPPAPRIVAA